MTEAASIAAQLDRGRAAAATLDRETRELARLLDTATTHRCHESDTPQRTVDGDEPAEYLSVRELARRVPYAEQTIRNLMLRGVFRLGEHYIKPRARVMFRWSKVREWLDQQGAT